MSSARTVVVRNDHAWRLDARLTRSEMSPLIPALAIRPCVYLSLTFDHRVVDGATGDGFMTALKHRLEGWT